MNPSPGSLEYKLHADVKLLLTGPRADITRWEGDAIVNAANRAMLGGGGVDGAIHRKAGPELVEACAEEPEVAPGIRCPTGEARITPGFKLPARYVIHTVGPVYKGAERSAPLLTNAYKNSISLANSRGLRQIAFPAISCGVYGYPYPEAAEVSLKALQQAVAAAPDGTVQEVHFVLYDPPVYEAYVQTAGELLQRLDSGPAASGGAAAAAAPATANLPAAPANSAPPAGDGPQRSSVGAHFANSNPSSLSGSTGAAAAPRQGNKRIRSVLEDVNEAVTAGPEVAAANAAAAAVAARVSPPAAAGSTPVPSERLSHSSHGAAAEMSSAHAIAGESDDSDTEATSTRHAAQQRTSEE